MTSRHGTAVSRDGSGALILGASGSGKSALALQLMALGADLVADDAVEMRLLADDVILACPDSIKGIVEARGVGILTVKSVDTARLAFVVNLDESAPSRLPEAQNTEILGQIFPLICGKGNLNLGAIVWCLLGGGQILPTQ